ncbi:PIG-L deacetylase family protein [Kiloniella sp.]|uniref:PIG-L deacetylase family protein n=1 Tax=Kiloniella sp. TaxID=1938587 RepID=UPI003A8D2A51
MSHVFLFSHQDDEFGVFKVIDDLVSSKHDVHIVYLTTGTLDGSISIRRNTESIDVLSKLGIKKKQIHFIGCENELCDGKLYQNLHIAEKNLDTLFNLIGPPSTLYIHAWEGGHQDHDAAHILGLAMAQKHACLEQTFQFSLYNGYTLPWVLYNVLKPIPENGPVQRTQISWTDRMRFITYCCRYPSQLKTWIGLLPFTLINYLLDGHQKLQLCDINRIQHPPHTGVLLYQARKVLNYKNFNEGVSTFSQQHFKN